MDDSLIANPSRIVSAGGQKVMLALPFYKTTNPITAVSIMGLLERRKMSLLLDYGDAFVAHVRNNCVQKLLDSDCDWMFSLDDDMVVPFGNAAWFKQYSGINLPDKFAGLNAVDRLLSHGKKLVGALYYGRTRNGKPMYSEGMKAKAEAEFARSGPHDLCKPTRWVGTGCILVHRSVFLDIEAKFPRLCRAVNNGRGHWFTSSEHNSMDRVGEIKEFLANGPMTGEKCAKAYDMVCKLETEAKHKSTLGLGEDVQFCIRAQEAGHQPHVDMGLICGHVGQHIFGPHNTVAE